MHEADSLIVLSNLQTIQINTLIPYLGKIKIYINNKAKKSEVKFRMFQNTR